MQRNRQWVAFLVAATLGLGSLLWMWPEPHEALDPPAPAPQGPASSTELDALPSAQASAGARQPSAPAATVEATSVEESRDLAVQRGWVRNLAGARLPGIPLSWKPSSSAPQSLVTDDEGRFELSLPEGSSNAHFNIDCTDPELQILAFRQLGEILELCVVPKIRFAGRVVNEYDQPIPGVFALLDRSSDDTRGVLDQVDGAPWFGWGSRFVTLGSAGKFRFEPVPQCPGSMVTFIHPVHGILQVEIPEQGADDAHIVYRGIQEQRMLVLRVLDRTDRPVRAAAFVYNKKSYLPDDAGELRLGIQAADPSPTLIALRPGFRPVSQAMPRFHDLTQGEGLGIDIPVVQASGRLLVTVLDSDGNPVEGATLGLLDGTVMDGRTMVEFCFASEANGRPYFDGPMTNEHGQASLQTLEQRPYSVIAIAPYSLQRVEVHGVLPSLKGTPVEIHLPDDATGGELSGIVLDAAGNPQAGVTINTRSYVVEPGPDFTTGFGKWHSGPRTETDAEGAYRLPISAAEGLQLHLSLDVDSILVPAEASPQKIVFEPFRSLTVSMPEVDQGRQLSLEDAAGSRFHFRVEVGMSSFPNLTKWSVRPGPDVKIWVPKQATDLILQGTAQDRERIPVPEPGSEPVHIDL